MKLKNCGIMSFTYPTIWEIEKIKDNEIPQSLLMELLGGNIDILFCEGDAKSGNDLEIYSIIFPPFTIIPVESCFSVNNYTKAFNKILE